MYVCTDKDWLIFDHWTLMEDGTVVMRDAPAPTPEKPEPPTPPTPTPVPPTPTVPQTGDMNWLWIALGVIAALSAGGLLLIFKRSGTHDEDEES